MSQLIKLRNMAKKECGLHVNRSNAYIEFCLK